MASSGSIDFNATRNQLITTAYRLGGIIRSNQALSAAQIDEGTFALNAMVKTWMVSGIHVWTTAEAVLIPQAGQFEYSFGPQSIPATLSGVLYAQSETELAADAAAAATVLSVVSTNAMEAGHNIGILVDDGTFHYTTIVSVVGLNVTITAALPTGAEDGTKVFSFTNGLPRPLKIVSARRRNMFNNDDTPLEIMARGDYNDLSKKNRPGLPTSIYYDPGNRWGTLHLYPREDVITSSIYFTFHRPIEDFDNPTDDADFPQEWIKALYLGLALDMGMQYSIPEQRYNRIKEQLVNAMSALSGHDREQESLFLQPDMS